MDELGWDIQCCRYVDVPCRDRGFGSAWRWSTLLSSRAAVSKLSDTVHLPLLLTPTRAKRRVRIGQAQPGDLTSPPLKEE